MGNGYKLVFSNIDINRQLNTYLINRSTLYAISFHSPGAVSTQEFCVSDLCTCHCLIEAGVYFRIQTWVYIIYMKNVGYVLYWACEIIT